MLLSLSQIWSLSVFRCCQRALYMIVWCGCWDHHQMRSPLSASVDLSLPLARKWIIRKQRYIYMYVYMYIMYYLVHITWPPANQIAWNVSPDSALNRVKHTLPCVKFLNARQSSDSRAQEREGHTLSTKTFRSHVVRDCTVFNALRQGQ